MKILSFLICNCIFVNAYKSRIIGGEVATEGQFPYLAAVYKTTSDGTYFCGGTLLIERWILTAGQCVANATSFTVYLGTTNIKTPSENHLKLSTDEYVLHPEYNPTTLENDIGMIKIPEIRYTNYIWSILLPESELEENTQIRAVGWGETTDDSVGATDELRWVDLRIISNTECKVTYGDQIIDTMLCVVGNNTEGTCHSDTGSPLVWYLRGRAPIHYGVASFVSGNGCESTDPSGFTRTLPYVEWIRDVALGNLTSRRLGSYL